MIVGLVAHGALTCAVLEDRVVCWGSGGQMGLPYDVIEPTEVDVPRDTVQLALSRDMACARDDGGAVFCYLRDGEAPPTWTRMVDDAVDVAVGSDHGCALDRLGRVWCFGENTRGQLGRGRGAGAMVVEGLEGVDQIGVGGSHSCARTGGDVWCWGDALALGVDWTEWRSEPLKVAEKVVNLAVDSNFVCVDGKKKRRCWGWEPTEGPIPEAPKGLVATGSEHTCTSDGEAVWCSGEGREGQLGPLPAGDGVVGGISEPVVVDAGDDHTCALQADDAVLCWGSNEGGQLGIEGPESAIPVEVLKNVKRLRVFGSTTCGITKDGDLRCVGAHPVEESGVADVCGGYASCVLDRKGEVRCAEGEAWKTVASGADQLSCGWSHGCVVKVDGTVACWGHDRDGRLGRGTLESSEDRLPLGRVPGVSGATDVWILGDKTCAETRSQVLCWGAGAAAPLVPDDDDPIIRRDVAFGRYHSCTLADAQITCTGDPEHGRLGDGAGTRRDEPVRVELP